MQKIAQQDPIETEPLHEIMEQVLTVPIAERSRSIAITWLNHYSATVTDWDSMRDIDYIGIDGTLLQMMLRSQGVRLSRSSADLNLGHVITKAQSNNCQIVFIGGKPGVSERAAQRFPKTNIRCFDGFSDISDTTVLIDAIRAAKAELIVLGLGAPTQDRLAALIKNKVSGVIVFTAGGWFDQLCVSENYFPDWVHAWRLGWAWRLAHEPRRLFIRYTRYAIHAALKRRQTCAHLRDSGFHHLSVTNSLLLENNSLLGRGSAKT